MYAFRKQLSPYLNKVLFVLWLVLGNLGGILLIFQRLCEHFNGQDQELSRRRTCNS